MNISLEQYKRLLDFAHAYALGHTGCKKVSVGAVIIEESHYLQNGYNIVSCGANRAIPDICRSTECRRVQLYGEDSRNHRLPADCRAIHSEVDAIINAQCDLTGTSIIVTRYPCEACARAIVTAGISTVIYGRKQKISEETLHIFTMYGITVIHIEDWDAEDTER